MYVPCGMYVHGGQGLYQYWPLQVEQHGGAWSGISGSPPMLCPPGFLLILAWLILFFAGGPLGARARGGSLHSLPLHGSDSSGSLRSLFTAIGVLVFRSGLSSLAFR